MQAEWEPDELIDAWTLTEGDWDLIANKTGVTAAAASSMPPRTWVSARRLACLPAWLAIAAVEATRSRPAAFGTGMAIRPASL